MKSNNKKKLNSGWARIGIGLVMSIATSVTAQNYLDQWNFENGNLDSSVGGVPMNYRLNTAELTTFGTTTDLSIPDIEGNPAPVMAFGALNSDQGYFLPIPVIANPAGAQFMNEYSIIMDLYFAAESAGNKRALVDIVDEANLRGANGAEYFVSASGGLAYSDGDGSGNVDDGAWHRIALVSNPSVSQLQLFIDGVLVGSQQVSALDGKFAMDGGLLPVLFTDENGASAGGYVSSVQVRDVSLSVGEIAALAGPTADGIPQEIPEIPSFIESYPNSGFVESTDSLVIRVNPGDTTISDVSLTLNDTPADLVNTTEGAVLVYTYTPETPFTVPSSYSAVFQYTENGEDGAEVKLLTFDFKAVYLFEDFESIELGPNLDEGLAGDTVYSLEGPAGWVKDSSGVPLGEAGENGVDEWAGWGFANKDWWVATAEDQQRSAFLKGQGTVMIADPDEWDDQGHGDGKMTIFVASAPAELSR